MMRSRLFVRSFCICFLVWLWPFSLLKGQTVIDVFPSTHYQPVSALFTPGVFFVPKTADAYNDFMTNNVQQGIIRSNVIESALNNASSLNSCLALLNSVQADLTALSQKCQNLVFIFEKMPPWLSSSSNGAAAATPGWSVLNTKPPASWNTWQTVVDSITDKIVNQFGISNAWFEIWNEPDLGSWTGTKHEYFLLYRYTYDGIKAAGINIPAGGPAVNFWSNNIGWQAPYGSNPGNVADSSLIHELLDTALALNRKPDFLSWHNFNLTWNEYDEAVSWLQFYFVTHAVPPIPMIISEWNAPAAVRDSRLGAAYVLKSELEMSRTSLAGQVIAAWQDFSPSSTEFHNDYGLLSYGAIHKPAYYAQLIGEKLNGVNCLAQSSQHFDGAAAVVNDTLFIMLSNYAPPPFLEALNHTLYAGQYNVNQLDSAGYIDIQSNNLSHLDSIYRGLIVLPGTDALQQSISNSVGIYAHYDTLASQPRNFSIHINGFNQNYQASYFLVDSTTNNYQFRYDSLRSSGYTQTAAIVAILPVQGLRAQPVMVNGGLFSCSLQPNAFCLLRVEIPGLNSTHDLAPAESIFHLSPNPAADQLYIRMDTVLPQQVLITDVCGREMKRMMTSGTETILDLQDWPSGLYFMSCGGQVQKFIHQ